MIDRDCVCCGKTFTPKGNWAKECFDCWKAGKQKRGEWNAGKRSNYQKQGGPPPAHSTKEDELTVEMLRFIVRACHPDKHPKQADMANVVTRWAITLGKQMHVDTPGSPR